MKYTLHVDFEAENDGDALETVRDLIAHHIEPALFTLEGGTSWDISGVDEGGNRVIWARRSTSVRGRCERQ